MISIVILLFWVKNLFKFSNIFFDWSLSTKRLSQLCLPYCVLVNSRDATPTMHQFHQFIASHMGRGNLAHKSGLAHIISLVVTESILSTCSTHPRAAVEWRLVCVALRFTRHVRWFCVMVQLHFSDCGQFHNVTAATDVHAEDYAVDVEADADRVGFDAVRAIAARIVQAHFRLSTIWGSEQCETSELYF